MQPHYDREFRFHQHEIDPVTEKDVVKIRVFTKPEKDIKAILLASMGAGNQVSAPSRISSGVIASGRNDGARAAGSPLLSDAAARRESSA